MRHTGIWRRTRLSLSAADVRVAALRGRRELAERGGAKLGSGGAEAGLSLSQRRASRPAAAAN